MFLPGENAQISRVVVLGVSVGVMDHQITDSMNPAVLARLAPAATDDLLSFAWRQFWHVSPFAYAAIAGSAAGNKSWSHTTVTSVNR